MCVKYSISILAGVGMLLSAGSVFADVKGPGIGKPGNISAVTRTIDVVMTDNRFSLNTIRVKKGETIRFKISNAGEFIHEFNIGTVVMQLGHQKKMMKMFESGMLELDRINHGGMSGKMGSGKAMKHDDPNSVLLEPGKSAEMVWKFSENNRLEFACNIPGHYEAGMRGKIVMK
jgi:uncharacterized cupredoxin-like copper-binding protein